MANIAGVPGHQKLVSINGKNLFLEDNVTLYPVQELEQRHYIQGGPRAAIYYLGAKMVRGSFNVPLLIDEYGLFDEAVKEILLCAEYPLRDMRIDTNYVRARFDITDDYYDFNENTNKGFNVYENVALENCGITDLVISVPNSGPARINVNFIGRVSYNNSSVTLNVENRIRRAIIYADCSVKLENPEYVWQQSKSFTIRINNVIEPLIVLLSDVSRDSWTDQPKLFSFSTSKISGEIVHAVDRGKENASLPTGGFVGTNLIFDICGTCLFNFPYVVFNLTEQPIGMGLLERNTRFEVIFGNTMLTSSNDYGHFINFIER